MITLTGFLPLAGSGIAGVPPLLLPDVPLGTVLAFAALNPATVATAFLLGRRVDQPAKLLVAAFAAALAGALLLWLGTLARLTFVATPARAAAGIFVAALVFGLAYAALGYATRARGARPSA